MRRSPARPRERAASLNQQGEVLSAQGNLSRALKSHREGLAIAGDRIAAVGTTDFAIRMFRQVD